jgi:hypothetical protein
MRAAYRAEGGQGEPVLGGPWRARRVSLETLLSNALTSRPPAALDCPLQAPTATISDQAIPIYPRRTISNWARPAAARRLESGRAC